ncbi:MAG: hypothetical protein ACI9MC_000602 [Kiritimatiellia bacterium]|jgi:hypothetical protein
MRLPLLLLLLTGCSADPTPTWATQSLWIGPSDGAGITGFHTWSIYGPNFERRGRPRHFVCSMVFQLTLQDDHCDDYTSCWRVAEELVDTDCDGVVLPTDLTLSAVGLGEISPELAGQDPYPLADAGSYVRFGEGPWLAHGWAFPGDATESSVPTFQFDDFGQMSAWPAWSYPLQP